MKLIDGDELIELLLSTAITDKQMEYSECVQYAVQKMPTVDAVPVVHGFWINIMEGNAFRRKCSVCGEVFIGNSDKHDFCGCCGADMRKDGEHD